MTTYDVIPRNLDLSKFVGQWVLIYHNKILANNKHLAKLKKEIKLCKQTPTLVWVPQDQTLIY